MIDKTLEEFLAEPEKLLISAVAYDDFLRVSTKAGNAIIISEQEWNVLKDGMQMLIKKTIKNPRP